MRSLSTLPEPEKRVFLTERNTATLAGNSRHDAQNTVAPGGATVAQHPQHSPPTVAVLRGCCSPGSNGFLLMTTRKTPTVAVLRLGGSNTFLPLRGSAELG
jgi:hypothetical protein